jgi:hypothetical protein
MLFMDQLRGEDSTGIVSVYNNGETDMLKEAVSFSEMRGYELYGRKQLEQIKTKFVSKGSVLMGHNRKATMGQITDNNAHPFTVNDGDKPRWLLMHNGTLRNHKKLGDFEIDSEALANHLVYFQSPEELGELLGQVEGAYALQWYDMKAEKLYIVRNSERPLWLAKTSAGWCWASELAFIYAACNRNRIKIEEHFEVKANTLYTLNISNIGKGFEETALTVKKSIPTLPMVVGKGGNNQTVSNKALKKIRQSYLGKPVSFWLDDYTDRQPNRPIDNPSGDWLCWGSNEELFHCPHQIIGTIYKTNPEEMRQRENGLFNGTVMDISLDEKTKMLSIMLYSIQPQVYKSTSVVH